jgi:hypothetical protein
LRGRRDSKTKDINSRKIRLSQEIKWDSLFYLDMNYFFDLKENLFYEYNGGSDGKHRINQTNGNL